MPLLTVSRVALLAGPVALAFFAGGYGDRARLWALAGAGLVLALVALSVPGRLVPRSWAPRVALGGLIALAAWVALSRTWAPLADAAGDDAERLALYALGLTAGALAWRERAVARRAEPAVALGTLIVTGYGMAGRLLPDLVPQTPSALAGGRFEQPLTYWNASGLYAALGLLLCARMAGDGDRPAWLRCAAVAAAVPLGSGTYLSFSRGALFALAAGLVTLIALAPTRPQLRGTGLVLAAAVLGLLGPLIAPTVGTLEGTDAVRARQGAIALAVGLAVAAAGVGAMRLALGGERAGQLGLGRLRVPPWTGRAALALVVALALVPVVAAVRGGAQTGEPSFGATSGRLASVDSNRYDYWRVAVGSWVAQPLRGVGAGGYVVEWTRERPRFEPARDAHSLPLETLAELGLIGLALLAATVTGIAACARRVQCVDPALAAGPAAALVTFGLHASLDWDWELPAVSLPALTLAGLLVARADAPDTHRRVG